MQQTGLNQPPAAVAVQQEAVLALRVSGTLPTLAVTTVSPAEVRSPFFLSHLRKKPSESVYARKSTLAVLVSSDTVSMIESLVGAWAFRVSFFRSGSHVRRALKAESDILLERLSGLKTVKTD